MSIQPEVIGGWSVFRHLTPEERILFDKVMQQIIGVGYEPLSVSTQIVEGTNYRFRALGTIIIPSMSQFNATIEIQQHPKGEAILISIIRE